MMTKKILFVLLFSPGLLLGQLPQVIATGPNPINTLIEFQDSLFIGGSFGSFNGQTSYYSLTYDGVLFDTHDQMLSGSGFAAFIEINDTLWGVGNELGSQNLGLNSFVNSIAYRDSGRWKGSNKFSVNNTKNTQDLIEYQGRKVLAGGFTLPYSHIAEHNGNNFIPMSFGLDQYVSCLAVYNGELYAAGGFQNSGPNAVSFIAKWNGSAWLDVGGGFDSNVNCMEVWNGDLYVGGNFNMAGGLPAHRVARWDGSQWSSLGLGLSTSSPGPNFVTDFYASSTGLYVGGVFDLVDGQPGVNLAKWNGMSFSVMGALDPLDWVYSITEFQGELYFSTYKFGLGAIGKLWGPGSVGVASIEEHLVKVYPNPSAGVVNVESEKDIYSMSLFNIQGQSVRVSTVNAQTFVLNNLERGMYFLELRFQDSQQRMPIIVE